MPLAFNPLRGSHRLCSGETELDTDIATKCLQHLTHSEVHIADMVVATAG